jgi:hypothetical protein
MSFRTVAAGRGVEWVTEGAKRLIAKPEVFGLMALIIALIGIVPGASLILGPALMGGMMYSMREFEGGRNAEVGQLFTAFQQPGKIGPMLMLCLPMVIVGIVVGILVVFTIFSAAAFAGRGGGAGFGIGALLCGLVGLVLGIAAIMATFFATPRVMLDNMAPIDAMKESVSAALANIGAIIIYVVLMFFAVLILSVLMVIPLLGPLVLSTVVIGVSAAASYTAYLDVFGASAVAPPSFPPSMGPPPPDAPPPPPM